MNAITDFHTALSMINAHWCTNDAKTMEVLAKLTNQQIAQENLQKALDAARSTQQRLLAVTLEQYMYAQYPQQRPLHKTGFLNYILSFIRKDPDEQISEDLRKYGKKGSINLVLQGNVTKLQAFLAGKDCPEAEVRAALRIAKYAGRPPEFSATLNKHLQEHFPKPTWGERFMRFFSNTDPVVDIKFEDLNCKDFLLQQQIFADFMWRRDLIDKILKNAKQINNPATKQQIKIEIREEIESLEDDWSMFLEVNDKDAALEMVGKYLEKRKPISDSINKQQMVLLFGFAMEDLDEKPLLNALERTVQARKNPLDFSR